MTFSDAFREKPTTFTRYLKTDWSAEDKVFRDGLAHFRESIALGNPIVAPQENEKIGEPQPVPAKRFVLDVEDHPEKVDAIEKDQTVQPVESSTVGNVGSPIIGSPQLAVSERALEESNLPTKPSGNSAEDLDDFFGGSEAKPAAKPSAKPAAPSKPIQSTTDEDDLFGAPISGIEADEMKPEPAKPTLEPAKASKPEVKAPLAAAPAITPTPTAAPAKKEESEEPMEMALEGFGLEEFKPIQDTVNELLASTKKADLDLIVNELPNYAVEMSLDSFRKNPDILSDKIIQVQAKQDSLHALMMMIGPELSTLIEAWDYIDKVGQNFSNASNREKRAAQAKILMKDLWERFVMVKRVHQSLDKAYKHLESQFNMLSRLITCSQDRNREVSRGAVPFEPSFDVAAEVAKQVSAAMGKMAPAHGKHNNVNENVGPDPDAPKISEGEMADDMFNVDMSQPLVSKKYKGMPEFPKNAGKLAQRDDKMKIGITDF